MRTLIATILLLASTTLHAATAEFAGGCFWCMEADFEKKDGVLDVVSGFTGGTLKNPTYSGNHAGHYEAVRVTYDPEKISYEELLLHFWRNIDPFDDRGQFCDKGFSYRTAIFVGDDAERNAAQASFAKVTARFPDQDIATEILPASTFWPVEAYHQDYAEKNPLRYRYYRWGCGRDQRLAEIWGENPPY
ncbi:MAG: peptide-methionine (S)-S-oxide reductase MsrA [Chromatocurvus sp.]